MARTISCRAGLSGRVAEMTDFTKCWKWPFSDICSLPPANRTVGSIARTWEPSQQRRLDRLPDDASVGRQGSRVGLRAPRSWSPSLQIWFDLGSGKGSARRPPRIPGTEPPHEIFAAAILASSLDAIQTSPALPVERIAAPASGPRASPQRYSVPALLLGAELDTLRQSSVDAVRTSHDGARRIQRAAPGSANREFFRQVTLLNYEENGFATGACADLDPPRLQIYQQTGNV